MTVTAKQFKRMSAFEKGYTVYMLGAWADEPNVPASYKPSTTERDQYEFGQQTAVIEVQDAP